MRVRVRVRDRVRNEIRELNENCERGERKRKRKRKRKGLGSGSEELEEILTFQDRKRAGDGVFFGGGRDQPLWQREA